MTKTIEHKGYKILVTDESVFGLEKPREGYVRLYHAADGVYYTEILSSVFLQPLNNSFFHTKLDNFLIDWFRETLKY